MLLMFLVTMVIAAFFPILGVWLTRSLSGLMLGGLIGAIAGLIWATPVLMVASFVGLLLGAWSGFAWLKRQQAKSGKWRGR